MTFSQMESSLRRKSAEVAFQKALLAGELAHLIRNRSSALVVWAIKCKSTKRALELDPRIGTNNKPKGIVGAWKTLDGLSRTG